MNSLLNQKQNLLKFLISFPIQLKEIIYFFKNLQLKWVLKTQSYLFSQLSFKNNTQDLFKSYLEIFIKFLSLFHKNYSNQ